MRFLLRLTLLVLALILLVGCHGRGRGTRGGGGGGGTDGGSGGGGTSCDELCDHAESLGATDPDCMVDRAECESTCPSLPESLRECFIAASTCTEAIACGGGGVPDAGGGGGSDAGGGGASLCSDTCAYAADGECDDGGEGSMTGLCDYGTDCTDCGPRPADI